MATKRKSKRKLNQIEAALYDEEHTTKKFKNLCSGFLSMDHLILKHMIKHWILLQLDYEQLQLGNMKLLRNDTYFICNGEQEKLGIVPQCSECFKALKRLAPIYREYARPFIQCICDFMDYTLKQSQNKWHKSIISLISKGDSYQFILQPHPRFTRHRNIVYIISQEHIKRITDIDESPKVYGFAAECTFKALYEFFRKILIKTLICCKGIDNKWDDFYANEYGSIFPSARWISNGQFVVHRNCLLFSRKKVCTNCLSLRMTVLRSMKMRQKRKGMPSKFTPKKHLTRKDLLYRIKSVQIRENKLCDEARMLSLELNRYKKQYNVMIMEDDLKSNDEYAKLLKFMLVNYHKVKLGLQVDNDWNDDKILIFFDMVKYSVRRWEDYSKNDDKNVKRKGHRWSAPMLH